MLRIREEAVVDFVRGVYAERSAEDWCDTVLESALRVFADGIGGLITRGYTEWRGADALHLVDLDAPAVRGPAAHWDRAGVVSGYRALDGRMFERMYGRTHGGVASVDSGMPQEVMTGNPAWRMTWDEDVADALGLVVRDPNGATSCLSVGLSKTSPAPPRVYALLDKLAMHFAAGLRLATPTLAGAEAVLDADGHVVHTHGRADDQRAELDDGIHRRKHALRRDVTPAEALEVWQGLVAGRWSLVDFFDTDGKRFVLAMKNPPVVAPRAELTARERRVAALVAMGHRDKEVAYLLGLSVAAVSTTVRRVRMKLDVKTRAELATVWRTRC